MRQAPATINKHVNDTGSAVDSVESLTDRFAELCPCCTVRTTNMIPPLVSAIDFVMVVADQSSNTASATISSKMPKCATDK